jgi:replication fork protection complex subunit Tof1/Swi1
VRHLAGPSKEAQDKFERHGEPGCRIDQLTADLDADTEERRKAVALDQHLRLMLKLVGFEQTAETHNADRTWFIPETVMPDSLKASIGALNQYLLNPPTLDKDPKTLVRPARQRRIRTPEYDSDGEIVVRAPRKNKRKDELQVFKSAAYIDDSDDEADDEAFFSREAQLRAEMNALAQAAGHVMRKTGTKRKRKNKGIEPMPLADMDVNMLDDDGDDEPGVRSPTPVRTGSPTPVPTDSDDEDFARRLWGLPKPNESDDEDSAKRGDGSPTPTDTSEDEQRFLKRLHGNVDLDDESPVKRARVDYRRARVNFTPVSATSDTPATQTQTQTRRRRAVVDSDEDE